jgi:RNA polymerase sigma factor (sigma-70 family)
MITDHLMPPLPSPTVFVVDDDAAVRKAVSRLLRSAGIAVAAFASPGEFLAQYNPATPGCLVLDISMPDFNGLQLQTTLGAKGSILPIIFLTGHGDVSKSVQAMKHGAFDFLTKPVKDKDLLTAVRAAIERDAVARREQANLSEIRARLDTLTPREREVLEHVVAGKLNKQIAADLGITEATVKMHRARVMAKMKVQSVAELACLTERCGIRGTNSLKSAA